MREYRLHILLREELREVEHMRSEPLNKPHRPWHQERHLRAYVAAVVDPAFIGWLLLIVAVMATIDGLLANAASTTRQAVRHQGARSHH